MDLVLNAEEQAFQTQVREFLATKMPPEIQERVRLAPSYVPKEYTGRWQQLLYEQGWGAPGWPVEYGGTGWNAMQKYIYDAEYQAADCPRQSPFGISMVGPVICAFGTDAQKEQHLGPIIRGEKFWCQGYSEPGSGSDLASLSTRAVANGDDYVINGHKIWTSHAHHADWMFCLTRTDPDCKPQEGISFILIDMSTPGITVKPIISIDGHHYLNEVFFDDVRVPVANRIGEENKGWTYAKFLLGHERTGIAGVGKSKRKVERLKDIAGVELDGGQSVLSDPSFRARISQAEVALQAVEFTQLRILAQEKAGQPPGPEASTLKIGGTQVEQTLNELMIEAIGNYAAPFPADAQDMERNEPPIGPAHGVGLMQERLLRRAATIYGGSNEIQRNIIAKAVLEL
ncbi:MAG: pimeloyl-CoA dehydrogenase large subunit [Rhodospirillaceae bacterium]|jgi:alkylation response protein AidB-like acyl-CoA dehydrogenase|nr:pimeloyl-CoA dehydrogenase large subunit [Rhodospirillaceae bacterium]MBT4490382.1 pimeloyl-CoA dehydrogenase large subunit [Rhodospirillaceae bacterium]MBT5050095.1 pimeloyl-CoA dehydrogenase large subunit [Rhodospirillaceae bacterium]MBT6430065.1 pimeloyl-CoA dehydrogenase large subunit [Rhodospirillaceae bacterium]MBT7758257.1 pimeloyl-CoA dehydrogenase large subunit [Rhodospirillaceae bacterium]